MRKKIFGHIPIAKVKDLNQMDMHAVMGFLCPLSKLVYSRICRQAYKVELCKLI